MQTEAFKKTKTKQVKTMYPGIYRVFKHAFKLNLNDRCVSLRSYFD